MNEEPPASRKNMRLAIVAAAVAMAICSVVVYVQHKGSATLSGKGKNTVEDIVAKYGEAAHKRLKPKFESAGVSYPPAVIKLLGLKTEKLLEIYSQEKDGKFHYVCTYPILGTSAC